MGFLIDTNVLSELRKGARADANVRAWFTGTRPDELFVSVLTIGEVVRGIERLRRRDPASAQVLDAWRHRLQTEFADRVLPVDVRVAQRWGTLDAGDPFPAVDGLIAATALVHGLAVATRNVADFERTGVGVVDPWRVGAPAG